MTPDLTPRPLDGAARAEFSAVLCGLDGACSEIHTIADILQSLTDLTAGAASGCEFALMGQFLAERAQVIAGLHDRMARLIDDLPPP